MIVLFIVMSLLDVSIACVVIPFRIFFFLFLGQPLFSYLVVVDFDL